MKTTCPYCGVGCGVNVNVDDINAITVSGDKDHPANRGKLCSKGSDLAATLSEHDRLLYPTIDGVRVSWDQATSQIADQFKSTIEQYGRESVAFYVSGQILTEDYYVVNKLTKGWFGTANVDTNSRLCMASSVVGHKRAFGSDTVPGCYEDLESADMIVLVGSNLAWCHPVLYQRIMAEKERRPDLYIVVIDPRRTLTADAADLHLALQPDSDAALFNGLLRFLAIHNACDTDYINRYVNGFDTALEAARQWDLEDVAALCKLDGQVILDFYHRFLSTDRTVTVYSQGVNQSSCGTDKVNAIINCHLATGRIGKPGMGPFSVTGQPNAMGGREVGGLATMLACHMELNNPQHRDLVKTFWNSPHIADQVGLCAVDLFEAVDKGNIKAIWIMGTNPVDSLPEANKVQAALLKCPLVVVSDVVKNTDTLAVADICLPAQAWGEKDGTVTNSERCISRQRRLKPAFGEAQPDWWAVCEVARKLGYEDGFAFDGPADVFREYATLSGVDNDQQRDFDISACANLSNEQYQQLQPFYWPWRTGDAPSQALRFFSKGDFFTPDKRANMLPIDSPDKTENRLEPGFPLILNSGRNRDQWHTMTRTGYSARLSRHLAEPYIAINPSDARDKGIDAADLVCVRSRESHVILRALITERQQSGQVFAPMHWTDQFSHNARIDTLMSSVVDPFSKQPASKYQPVSLEKFRTSSYAYGITRDAPNFRKSAQMSYWAVSPIDEGWQFEAASDLPVKEFQALLLSLNENSTEIPPELLTSASSLDSKTSAALFSEGQLHTLIFVDANPVKASRSWVQEQLSAQHSDRSKRWQLLAGTNRANQPDKGAIVCSCFSVGSTEIKQAVLEKGCSTVNSVGVALNAGTNCGSCRNEIQAIISRHRQAISSFDLKLEPNAGIKETSLV
ncbi:MAG: molybdopterin-dependent oxidoreductase [Granulosicoccus sp.]